MKALFLLLLLCLCCCGLIDCQRRRIEHLPRLTFATNFNQYSGYLTSISGRRLFYWLVESSEVPPADAPLVLWMNGGPGCSSVGGLLMTNGPFLANDRAELEPNKLAWNRLANMLYIDSPNGVGLSEPGPLGKSVLNDRFTTGLNMGALMHFFALFPEYRGRPFYIAGESYGGIYIPLLAHEIRQNSRLYPEKINLKGIAVGNGLHMPTSDSSFSESGASYNNEAGISFAEINLPRYAVNPYNIAKPCPYPILPDTYPCLNSTGLVSYLNDPQVRRALGVNEAVSTAYIICSDKIAEKYILTDRDVLPELKAFANGDVSVMLYHGTLDSLLPTKLTQGLLLKLPQNASDDDPGSTDGAWYYCFDKPGVSGESSFFQIGGLQKSYLRGRIRYRTVIGAGHSVVTDRPDMGFQILADFLGQRTNSPLCGL